MLWILGISSAILLVCTTVGLIYMSTLLSSDQRAEFTAECNSRNGTAIESKDSMSRTPTLYCIHDDIIVLDEQIELASNYEESQ